MPDRTVDESAPGDGPAPDRLVLAMAEIPGLAAQVLADHVDDGTGHCRGCALDPRRRPVLERCGPRGIAALAVAVDVAAP